MNAEITVNDERYELQISARRIVDGSAALPLDENETSSLFGMIREDLLEAICATDYAAEEQGYAAAYESDEECRAEMFRSANEWCSLAERLRRLME